MKTFILNIFLLTTSLISFAQSLVKDIYPGAYSGTPYNFTAIGTLTFFIADDGTHGSELWKTDGTTLGTQMITDINPGNSHGLAYLDAFYYNITPLLVMNSRLYFFANDGSSGIELWTSDGTASGTSLVKDINPGSGSSAAYMDVEAVVAGNNTLYFAADNGTDGIELWKSDGTAGGTQLVKNINSAGSSSPINFFVDGDKVYFGADNGPDGTELWVSDGTTLGTSMVIDINAGAQQSYPNYFRKMNDKIYFSAYTAGYGLELWVTDGTGSGTSIVKDFYPGPTGGYSSNVVVFNNQLILAADDGVNGTELWISDGTTSGTQLLKNIRAGSGSGYPGSLTVFNGKVFFTGYESTYGNELWATDGTTLGTSLFLDINNVANNSANPGGFYSANGHLYFWADDGTNGAELWRTDGTVSGTAMLNQMCLGSCNSYPGSFFKNGNTLFFTASETDNGRELYKLDLPNTGVNDIAMAADLKVYPNPSIDGCWQLEIDDNLIGSTAEVYDANGKLVFKSAIRNSKSEIAAGVARGVYLLRISSGKSSVVRKLVKI